MVPGPGSTFTPCVEAVHGASVHGGAARSPCTFTHPFQAPIYGQGTIPEPETAAL